MKYLFFTLFYLIVLLNIFAPRALWSVNRRFYKNPEANEPSDLAFTAQRVMGAIMLIAITAFIASHIYF